MASPFKRRHAAKLAPALLAPLFLLADLEALASHAGVLFEASVDVVRDAQAETAVPVSAERALSARLGLPATFAVGLGNDAATDDPNANHAYGLGSKLDIHYMYLSGLDWPSWNAPAGAYVTVQAAAARAHGMVPMFTLYQAAANGEGNLAAFDDPGFMTRYWSNVRLMLQRLAEEGGPAIVHLEPDLWGYAQQKGGDDPAAIPMKVGSLVPECVDLPDNVEGMASCAVRLSHLIAPKVAVGLSASTFGAATDGASDPARIGAYLRKLGPEADLTVVETLDRDAGCFEAGVDPNCRRGGSFYWGESDFQDHLAWAASVRGATGKPLLWWQMPLGVPGDAPGSAGRYRDNRVQYLFSHVAEFAAAGGIGAVFGTGAKNQTDATTDGGQFRAAVAGYQASPAPLR